MIERLRTVCGGTCGWGQLVLVVDVDSKSFLIPGVWVGTLGWVGSVRCWCGLVVWAVGGLLLAWALVCVVGVGVAWDVVVVAWRSSSTWNSTTQSMFLLIVYGTSGRNKLIALKAIR